MELVLNKDYQARFFFFFFPLITNFSLHNIKIFALIIPNGDFGDLISLRES